MMTEKSARKIPMETFLNKATHRSRTNKPKSEQGGRKKSGFKLKCCLFVCVHTCHGLTIGIKGKLVRVGSLSTVCYPRAELGSGGSTASAFLILVLGEFLRGTITEHGYTHNLSTWEAELGRSQT